MRLDASFVIPKPAREESPGRYPIALTARFPAIFHSEAGAAKNVAGGWRLYDGLSCTLLAGRSFASGSG